MAHAQLLCRSEVEHGVLEVISPNTILPLLPRLADDDVVVAARRRAAAAGLPREELVEVAPPALAREICVVRRRHQADGLGRTRKHVADRVGQVLKLVRRETDVVVDDVVVRRAGRALEAAVSCRVLLDLVGKQRCKCDVP